TGALALDSPTAYEAAVRLIEGQVEKVTEAGEGRDESRYAGSTLADMRSNLASARATHAVFRGWLLTKSSASAGADADRLGSASAGAHVDGESAEGFARLDAAYGAIMGDGLPPAPDGWSPVASSDAASPSPFSALFDATKAESDDTTDGSLAHSMDEA